MNWGFLYEYAQDLPICNPHSLLPTASTPHGRVLITKIALEANVGGKNLHLNTFRLQTKKTHALGWGVTGDK